MSAYEILDVLRPANFSPRVFVTNSGDRYPVRHSEMARILEDGTIYVFLPCDRDDAHVSKVIRLSSDAVCTIEPHSEPASSSDGNGLPS